MTNRPEAKRIPDDAWKGIVRYGVTPSLNLAIDDGTGAVLFLERMNEPVKGRMWLPGGRVRNGETREAAVARLAMDELGLPADAFGIAHLSDRSNDEMFRIADMGDRDAAIARYGEGVETVHYWGGVALLRTKGRPALSLDSQSGRAEWLRVLPENAHPYLRWYFRTLAEAGFPLLGS